MVLKLLLDKFFLNTEQLYPIIPFMGIVRNKLFPSRAIEQCNGKAQCRVSTNTLNVYPDGNIYACSDMGWESL